MISRVKDYYKENKQMLFHASLFLIVVAVSGYYQAVLNEVACSTNKKSATLLLIFFCPFGAFAIYSFNNLVSKVTAQKFCLRIYGCSVATYIVTKDIETSSIISIFLGLITILFFIMYNVTKEIESLNK